MTDPSTDPFDPQRLRLVAPTRAIPPVPASVPHHKHGERFLKGPIPWKWLQVAGRQPGKALHVAITLWHLAGMKRSARVSLSLSSLGSLGVTRYSAARGLEALRRAGLVHVNGRQGRKAIVTILGAVAEEGREVG